MIGAYVAMTGVHWRGNDTAESKLASRLQTIGMMSKIVVVLSAHVRLLNPGAGGGRRLFTGWAIG
jgi:hypothetical protein